MNRDPRKRLFEVAHGTGLGRPAVALYDALFDLTDYDVDPAIRAYGDPADPRGTVLFPLIQGQTGNAYRCCLLAHAFRCRGYRPVVVLCDGVLDACLRKADWDHEAVCDLCEHCGEAVTDAFGLDPRWLSDLVDEEQVPPASASVGEPPDAVTFHGVPVGRYALASTRKFLKKYHVDRSDPAEGAVYRRFLDTAYRLVLATERLLDRHDVVAAVSTNSMYVYGGIPLAVADAGGANAVTQMPGFSEGTMVFGNTSNRSSLAGYSDPDLLQRVVETPLSEAEAAAIDEVMERRFAGVEDRHGYMSMAAGETVEAEGTTLVGMFTNLIWDASLEVDEAPYPDVFDWVTDTVELLGGRDDLTLVVKLHPSERLFGTRESVDDWLDERRPLPDNVEVLPPDTDVDTYRLLDDLDVGIVYNSTVGLEMAYKGGPVVVGGDTHYRHLGFTHDVETSAEYRDLLDRVGDLTATPEMQARAKRYAHFLYVRKQVPFPFYETTADGTRPLPVSHDDVAPGAEPFDTVVERVIAGEPIYDGPRYGDA